MKTSALPPLEREMRIAQRLEQLADVAQDAGVTVHLEIHRLTPPPRETHPRG